jgi:pyridoxal 5'-phosphate synthase pdxS subunit
MRSVIREIRLLQALDHAELMAEAKRLGAPFHLVELVARTGILPVPNFAAGGIATPADAALMMQLGAQSVFVGSGIFKSQDPAKRAKAIVGAATYYQDPEMLAEISKGLLNAMPGLDIRRLKKEELLAQRGR